MRAGAGNTRSPLGNFTPRPRQRRIVDLGQPAERDEGATGRDRDGD